MINIPFLSSEEQDDSQALETDVMRFMAMIGIIFWMIFALVKSIPFEETKPSPVTPPAEIEKPKATPTPPPAKKTLTVIQAPPVELPKPPPERVTKPITQPITAPKKVVEKVKKTPKPAPVPPKNKAKAPPSLFGPPTLSINFRSMRDLEKLISNNQVTIYIRSSSMSFDLIFKSYLKGNRLAFTGGDSLPQALWEIKGGTDFNHFKRLLEDTYPVARTSPTKNVYVHFIDKRLESNVESMLMDLQKQKRYGKIRIDKAGEIKFEEFTTITK